MAEPLLSVCLPIFNQAEAFREQVRSISNVPANVKNRTEFVIVDDCSTDDLSGSITELRASGWTLTVFYNTENLGRAPTLARSIRSAQGRYILIMDGDDPFVEDGLAGIHEALISLEGSAPESDCVGMVFGTIVDDGKGERRNVLPDGLQCTLLGLRADHCISGDLKEVIKREAVLDALCPLFDSYRRVPTSLLWTRISDRGFVRCSSKVVVRKSYQAGGLTRNLEVHRSANLPPLLALYRGIADSHSYTSRSYRLRAAINYHRFLVRRGSRWRLRSDFYWIAGLMGVAVGLFERRQLRRSRSVTVGP